MIKLLSILVVCVSANAQLAWRNQTTFPGPTGRRAPATAFDTLRGRLVMFGGIDALFQPVAHTWEWDGSNWYNKTSPGPSPRCCASMAYDPQRAVIVLFGGKASGGADLNDTWEWNGKRWTLRSPSTSPPGRFSGAACWDSRMQRMVIYGGSAAGVPLDDFWQWDGTDWSQLRVTTPPARLFHGLVCDTYRGRLVVFGGWDGTRRLADTWEWNGAKWALVSTSHQPSARSEFGLCYDSARSRTVLFGGRDGVKGAPFFNDTWEWDGQAWLRRNCSPTPPGRFQHILTFDSRREQIVAYGGICCGAQISFETWELAPTHRATTSPYGLGCSSSLGVPLLTANRPWLGDILHFELAPITGMSWLNLGLRRLGITLAPIGMPGCSMLTTSETSLVLTRNGNSASGRLSLPLSSSLLGADLFAQAIVLAPLRRPTGVVTSQGLRLELGSR